MAKVEKQHVEIIFGISFARMPMVADGRGVGVKNLENLLTS